MTRLILTHLRKIRLRGRLEIRQLEFNVLITFVVEWFLLGVAASDTVLSITLLRKPWCTYHLSVIENSLVLVERFCKIDSDFDLVVLVSHIQISSILISDLLLEFPFSQLNSVLAPE